jgi:hypothetical protein
MVLTKVVLTQAVLIEAVLTKALLPSCSIAESPSEESENSVHAWRVKIDNKLSIDERYFWRSY